MARKILDWKQIGWQSRGRNPMLPEQEAELGKDRDGKNWSVRCRYVPEKKLFMVWFDNDEEYDVEIINDDNIKEMRESTQFFRTEVIYADNYWKAHREKYHDRYCDYEDIQNIVLEFVEDKQIR